MKNNEKWVDVDQYFTSKLHASDSIMDSVLKANSEANLPAIDVSPNQGKFLSVQGIRQFIDLLSEDSRIESTAIQTVGSKGYDGFAIGIVRG
ncbi:hypothetical protein J5Y03_15045 [Bacillus sp. RG28]|uniref:Uncharacterized protein n=1 Tax=Gottfriedia endophytica TaxID=2820819 RepID=A0A940NTH2_9BACI|nr:hypothetical protein [Gottfriedia endophytica]MBP0726476.1 hypothetical protein [Gottfriedia endophytica]